MIWKTPAGNGDPFAHLDLTGIDLEAIAREARKAQEKDEAFQARLKKFRPSAAALYRVLQTIVD